MNKLGTKINAKLRNSHFSGNIIIAQDKNIRNYTYEDVMKLIANLPLQFMPGSKLQYSNSNYVLLGHIIEVITNIDFQTYIRMNILQPLQMNATHWNYLDSDANSYIIYNGCRKKLGKSRCQGPDGGMFSTVYDLYQWILETSNHTILSEQNWNECFHVVVNSDKNSWPRNYGFGWTESGDWILHGGFQLGYCSGIAINNKLGYSVVILSNCYNNDTCIDPLMELTDFISNEGCKID